MRDIFISPSSLDEIQLCFRRYHFSRKRRLVPYHRPERMEKGTVGHKVLAYYYTEMGLNQVRDEKKERNQIIEESFKIGTLEAARTELGTSALNTLFENLTSYFHHYQDETWLPVLDDKNVPLVEVPLTKILYERPDEGDTEGVRVIFNGIIDLLVAPTKKTPLLIADHKFKDRFSELDPLSNQLSLYSATTGIADVMRNDVGGQKEGNVNKFRRQHFKYSKAQQDENLRWAIYWALEADYHEMVDIYPPNPTSCDKFGGCLYRKICNTIPEGREGVINADFKTGQRYSIYQDETKGPAALVEDGKGHSLEPAPIEVQAPPPVEKATETVPVLRETGSAVGDSVQGSSADRGLDDVQVPSEDSHSRDEVRDRERVLDGGAIETVADRLLKRIQ